MAASSAGTATPLTWLAFVPTYAAMVLASARALRAPRARATSSRALGAGRARRPRASRSAGAAVRSAPPRRRPDDARSASAPWSASSAGRRRMRASWSRALARLGGHEYVVFTDRPDAFAGVDVDDRARAAADALPPGDVGPRRAARPASPRTASSSTTARRTCCPWRLPGAGGGHRPRPRRVRLSRDVRAAAALAPPALRAAERARGAAASIADSEHARRDVLARFGVAAERVRVVPLGVADAFRTPPTPARWRACAPRHGLGERVVACVGTVQPRKRVERVIEAFVRAARRAEGWKLAIAGPHPAAATRRRGSRRAAAGRALARAARRRRAAARSTRPPRSP